MRKFEKISLEQFIKDTKLTEKEYNEITLPHRATTKSAGYDFHVLKEITLKPNEIKKIPTGIKAKAESTKTRTGIGYINTNVQPYNCNCQYLEKPFGNTYCGICSCYCSNSNNVVKFCRC